MSDNWYFMTVCVVLGDAELKTVFSAYLFLWEIIIGIRHETFTLEITYYAINKKISSLSTFLT